MVRAIRAVHAAPQPGGYAIVRTHSTRRRSREAKIPDFREFGPVRTFLRRRGSVLTVWNGGPAARMRGMTRRLASTIILVVIALYVAGYFSVVERGYRTNAGGTRGEAYISCGFCWQSIYAPMMWLESKVRGDVLIFSPVPLDDIPARPAGRGVGHMKKAPQAHYLAEPWSAQDD